MVSYCLREWRAPKEDGGAVPLNPRHRIHLKMPHVLYHEENEQPQSCGGHEPAPITGTTF